MQGQLRKKNRRVRKQKEELNHFVNTDFRFLFQFLLRFEVDFLFTKGILHFARLEFCAIFSIPVICVVYLGHCKNKDCETCFTLLYVYYSRVRVEGIWHTFGDPDALWREQLPWLWSLLLAGQSGDSLSSASSSSQWSHPEEENNDEDVVQPQSTIFFIFTWHFNHSLISS